MFDDLVSRCRAARIIVVGATQKPATDVIPSRIRDNMAYRWAVRTTTSAASDTILGDGMASEGHDASTISDDTPGVGLLCAEDSIPNAIRSYFPLDEEDVEAVVDRGVALRATA